MGLCWCCEKNGQRAEREVVNHGKHERRFCGNAGKIAFLSLFQRCIVLGDVHDDSFLSLFVMMTMNRLLFERRKYLAALQRHIRYSCDQLQGN